MKNKTKNRAIFDRYLLQQEKILWHGKPSPWRLLSSGDVMMMPFSLMWGGFAIFWTMMATGGGAPVTACQTLLI